MSELENKRIFLVATDNSEANTHLEQLIKAQVPNATVFTAIDGLEALFKCENVPPHVVVMDFRLPKVSAMDLTEKLLHKKDRTAVIILAPPDTEGYFMDHVVTGQIQFLSGEELEQTFANHLTRALNWVAQEDNAIYRLRFIGPGEQLLKIGEPGEHVYLVKSGELKAIKWQGSEQILLGLVKAGEFVGEMAYINGDARSADVFSITDCELIEIPSHSLDAVLFSKPAWSKALMKTLSKRLKISNEVKTAT